MIPALMAAKPLIKWGVIGGAVAIIVAITNWMTYDVMRSACEDEKNIAIQAAANAATESARQQLFATIDLNTKVTEERDQKDAELQTLRESVQKKARKYAHVKIAVPADLVRVHDEYARLSDKASRSSELQPADPSTGGAEVSPGAVPPQAEQRVSVTLGGETVSMTVEGVSNMLGDTYNKFGLCLNDYGMFNDWNEGREGIELKRLTREAN